MRTNQDTSRTLAVIAINALGLAVLAAFNPLLPHYSNPLREWAGSLLTSLFLAAIIYGLYVLCFRQHAKNSWPMSFLLLAWLLVGSTVFVPYTSNTPKQNALIEVSSVVESEIEKFPKDTPPATQRILTEEEMGFPPAKR
ncbi:hypothetical protein [Comamonas sp.]|uniref:hypothetical protein n=1 Tax=Comamonas sp. TaxID=34028 RepID=UPI002584ABFF|nr:hypothetical protein [Comamonas sp.]